MANYGALKTMKAAAIGTIMPWTGALTKIPAGWLICNGNEVEAGSYPLLAQAIGDTYGGVGFTPDDFPLYQNQTIFLPDISQKALADYDTSYFGSGAIDANIDTSEASASVAGFIGANTDNGVRTNIPDAYTEIVFNYTPENDFSGTIEEMTYNPGFGSRTVYTAPRKLGRRHVPIHGHPTEFASIIGNDSSRPGAGVSCSREVNYNIFKAGSDDFLDGAQVDISIEMPSGTGVGNGSDGVILANIDAEAPGPNLKPRNATSHGISNWIGSADAPDPPDPYGSPNNSPAHNRRFNQSDTAPYALGGGNLATEHINYDDGDANTGDGSSSDQHRPFEVFFNHSGVSFNKTTPGVGVFDTIDAHDHGSFQVDLDRENSSLRMPGLISLNNITANITPNNLDRALNINVNLATPKLIVLYIIRAY